MLRISIALASLVILAVSISCGAEAPADPAEIAENMLKAAQTGEYDRMRSYMSEEMHTEFNDAMLDDIEIISYTIDEIEYNQDNTEAEVTYSITLRERGSEGDAEVMQDDMNLIMTSSGDWIITEM
ncbi:MAG: hypothetical protein ABFR50_07110 [Candidatus Fermentibacteria bacterium]